MSFASRIPVPPRSREDEWLDDLATARISTQELADCLREVRRLDWLGGGTRTVLRHVRAMLPATDAQVLDVGTSASATPPALLRWARRANFSLDVTGLDINPQMLQEARRFLGDEPVRLVRGDARALPWPDGSFDVVTCLGFLHHFGEHEARQVLHEMWRVARVGIVVVDLERSYLTYLLAELGMHTIVHNRVTRHDGLISVSRSYTAPELRALARGAGLGHVFVRRHALFLQSLTARKM